MAKETINRNNEEKVAQPNSMSNFVIIDAYKCFKLTSKRQRCWKSLWRLKITLYICCKSKHELVYLKNFIGDDA